ncbi:hypothetical protein [Lyngbya aestuarii]|uniref:hypothetical protein n=1 Tax=Lyngbya aestuarii TaxID=118322 RepID=UPI00403DC651
MLDKSQNVECPNCGKNTVIQSQEGIYRCLSCNFERDFSEEPQLESGSGHSLFWASVVAAFLGFFVLQASKYIASYSPDADYQSSSTPTAAETQID